MAGTRISVHGVWQEDSRREPDWQVRRRRSTRGTLCAGRFLDPRRKIVVLIRVGRGSRCWSAQFRFRDHLRPPFLGGVPWGNWAGYF